MLDVVPSLENTKYWPLITQLCGKPTNQRQVITDGDDDHVPDALHIPLLLMPVLIKHINHRSIHVQRMSLHNSVSYSYSKNAMQ
jgi:hypothetical protein